MSADHSFPHAPIDRRRVLALFGSAAGVAAVAPSLLRFSAASAATLSPQAVCTLATEATEGPFYLDLGTVRSSIAEGRAGVPLTLRINVVDAATCSPLADAAVDVWHADALGTYSGEASEGTAGQTYLRGVQLTDATGAVQFETIMPGWYAGRTNHIHIKVRTGGTVSAGTYSAGSEVHTGQLFFDPAVNAAVAAVSPYSTNSTARLTNDADNIYLQQGGPQSIPAMTGTTSAYTGTITVAVNAANTTSSTTPTAALFTATALTRLFDTRDGIGVEKAKIGAGSTAIVDLTSLVPSGATAAVFNLTGTNATADTYITAYATDSTRPDTSNLNPPAGVDKANLAIVPLTASRSVSLYNHAGSVDLVVDLAGYFLAGTGVGFAPVTLRRVFDSRNGIGTTPARIGSGSTVALDLSSIVPATATSVVVNLTATNASASSYVVAYPAGVSRPATSSLNVLAGQTIANLAVIPLDSTRSLHLYNVNGSLDLLVDIAGYYATGAPGTTTVVAPQRVLDTRSGVGAPAAKLGANGVVTLELGGAVPSGADAVLLNLTATQGTSDTYITGYSTAVERPDTSNLNPPNGVDTANLALIPLEGATAVRLYNFAGATHLVADLVGYTRP